MATIKQKLVASKILENPGKSVSQAMRESGYKENSAKNPQDLTRSIGWQEIIDKYIREDKLLNVHKRLLNSVRLERYSFGLDISDEVIRKIISKIKGAKFIRIIKGDRVKNCYYAAPDDRVQLSALDMAYKIRGKYQIDNEELKRNAEHEAMWDRISKLLPDSEL